MAELAVCLLGAFMAISIAPLLLSVALSALILPINLLDAIVERWHAWAEKRPREE